MSFIKTVAIYTKYTHSDFVVAGGRDVCDGTLGLGRDEHPVLDESVLVHQTVQVSAGDVRAGLLAKGKVLLINIRNSHLLQIQG